MNRIDERFKDLKAAAQSAFIPFLTAGDPDLNTTRKIILGAEKTGADIIELGFPFSDPVADGPVIQASYTRVLERGQRSEDVLRLVESVRRDSDIPIVAMISYSLVYRAGFDGFLDKAMAAGLDGATIPDLPIEEAAVCHELAADRGFRLICFVTPTTTEARRSQVVKYARGFIYYISVRGITGVRDAVPPDLHDNIEKLRSLADVPVAVGFGISQPAHARAVAGIADGVIVGSAIVSRIFGAVDSGADPVQAAVEFIGTMASATHSPASDA